MRTKEGMRTQEDLNKEYEYNVQSVGKNIANAFTGSGKYKLVYGPILDGTSNCMPGTRIPGKFDRKFMEDLRKYLDKELELAQWGYRVVETYPSAWWRTAYVVIR